MGIIVILLCKVVFLSIFHIQLLDRYRKISRFH